MTILYSILNTFRTVGPFDLNWETQQYKCSLSQYITFTLLACLQSINLFWLFFIVKIAVNVVFSDVIKDVRSDDEEEEDFADSKKGLQATDGSASGPTRKVSVSRGMSDTQGQMNGSETLAEKKSR